MPLAAQSPRHRRTRSLGVALARANKSYQAAHGVAPFVWCGEEPSMPGLLRVTETAPHPPRPRGVTAFALGYAPA
ncbi:hypothetical protein APASM_1324 [Actinosynnema pretiosum subsp. pretiosum]|nr:hypothetical protein APASM_1324 [Actinosynnema pretiosum subsp. pretiosum]